ncbi:MAG: YneF family protein [Erysipelotrichaceae bacterium]|nr:YneF family protein [Erysipelotrichaceae bacterium]
MVIVALIIGLVGGFFGARKLLKRELEKNPPINENMIRAMFMSMGRKPSEAQIKSVMNSMKRNSNL